MNKLAGAVLASTLMIGTTCIFAAELPAEESAELRQRAETFQAERARNPGFEPGASRVAREPGDLRPEQPRHQVKAKHQAKPKHRVKAKHHGKPKRHVKAKHAKSSKAKRTKKMKTSHHAHKTTKAKHKRSPRNMPGAPVR